MARFLRSPRTSTLALVLALAAGSTLVDAGPAPPASDDPPAGAAPQPAQQRPKGCPRCGYICDATWRYCVRCGWDLQALAGRIGETRLEDLTRSVVRVVSVKNAPKLDQILSPRDYRSVRRYITWNPKQRKTFATALPFLERGLFVTSARSLAWSDSVQLITWHNRDYSATVLGYDFASGVGVLKADIPGIEPIPASNDGEGADEAWAVCFPVVFDEDLVRYLPVSLHRGRITGRGESGTYMASFEDLLRSDHTIPQGCLGGALIDTRGALAGMVLGSPDAGITYEVPARDLAAIAGRLARQEPLQRPYFGVGLVTADDRRRARFGITEAPPHPLVGFLIKGSPAAAAGVLPGDFLAAVDGEKVATVAAAGVRLLRAVPGGPPLGLTLLRAGREMPVKVVPASRPSRILLEPVDELQEDLEANLIEVSSGPTSQQGLRIANLVRGGRGEDDEFKEGDIIVSVNGKGVRHLETFNQIVRSLNPHIFAGAGAERDTVNMYHLALEVRTQGKEKEGRRYSSRFPDLLAPPVY